MTTYDWPSTVTPQTVSFNARGVSIGGQRTITGRQQIVAVDAGYWIASLTDFQLINKTHILAYRALYSLLEGPVHRALVPVYDTWQSPWPVINGQDLIDYTVPFDDDATFDDGSTFDQSVIDAVLESSAALRATQVTITFTDYDFVSALQGGEYFSIGERLYRVKSLADTSTDSVTVNIWPPLRAAVVAGDTVNFDNPVCKMKLVTEQEGDLDLQFGRRGFPTMKFVEAFD